MCRKILLAALLCLAVQQANAQTDDPALNTAIRNSITLSSGHVLNSDSIHVYFYKDQWPEAPVGG